MTELQKTTEPEELSADALAMIRWQEENPDVWDMKGHDDDYDENGGDLARLRENLKLTPAERLRRAGARMVFEKYGAKTRTIRELGGEI